jgi:DNA-binding NarL/FixJ family response regulator
MERKGDAVYLGTGTDLQPPQPAVAQVAVRLSRRKRDVLTLLLRGLSEKEVAHGLGIAQPTMHQHVGELYRRFGDCSRPELMACFIPTSAWTALR